MHADMYYIGPLAFQHETLKAGNGPGEEARYRLQILYHKAALVCMCMKNHANSSKWASLINLGLCVLAFHAL